MIEIEFKEPHVSKCNCCGHETITLTRFVHKDGEAHAIYYAKFTKEHPDKFVSGIISIGEWGDKALPKDRVAFPFRIWTYENNFQVGLVDSNESPWSNETFLGPILDRKDGLNHPWVKEIFHITDHIVMEDNVIIEYFNEK
jgi:hypothetical protein